MENMAITSLNNNKEIYFIYNSIFDIESHRKLIFLKKAHMSKNCKKLSKDIHTMKSSVEMTYILIRRLNIIRTKLNFFLN